MKQLFLPTLFCGFLGAALPSAHPTVADAQEASPLQNLPIERHTLANGLRVLLSPDRSVPTVAVAVYYDVGSRNEEVGRTGFAHLFEHMMFQGSANVVKGEHFTFIQNRGGDLNGTTNSDRTNYFETLPSNELALGLWLEADRMRSLQVTAENFENQRQVVKEERRQRIDNQPYVPSFLRIDELSYGDYFPYAHSTIGSMEDLDNAPLSAVQEFFSRYYRPNNAVLSVAGDFDSAEALAMIERYFGSIARQEVTPYTPPAFTPRGSERVETIDDSLAELPAFHMNWPIPSMREADHYALEILASALGDGESSRLYQELVKRREICQSISVSTDDRRGPDLLSVFAVMASGHQVEEAQTLVNTAIRNVTTRGISARELQKVKNRIRAGFVFGLQTNLSRARELAEFEMYYGDATLIRSELDRYLAVTREDVQRVARQYLVTQNRTVLNVRPVPSAEATPATSTSAQ